MCGFLPSMRLDILILAQWIIVYALYIKFGKGKLPSLRGFFTLFGFFSTYSETLNFVKLHWLFLIFSAISFLYFIVSFSLNTIIC